MSLRSLRPSVMLLAGIVLAGAALWAQTTTKPAAAPAAEAAAKNITSCGPVLQGQELKEPNVLTADPKTHVLSTTFSLQLKNQCVPVSQFDDKGNFTGWKNELQAIRTYVYPDPKTKTLRYGYPGPTLKIRKQVEETAPQNGVHAAITPGDRLKVFLVNDLPPDTVAHGKCDNACPANYTCPDKSQWVPASSCVGATVIPPTCCCWVNETNKWPDCFHGDNTTNLHFHGTHVSPQEPQDFVLLELRPKLPKGETPPVGEHGTHARGDVRYGTFQYDVDPPPPTQAEGTHWYHPHKHGSVSLQVANGLPGALLIEGPFDDWLRGYYKSKGATLTEKLLVVQQVQQNTNLYTNPNAPIFTVNGQVGPKITMQPGEVQRWRFVNATMNIAAQFTLKFPPQVKMKQIAQDGVRFAPENYATQPLFSLLDPQAFVFSPGNRADFLVQAPTVPGVYRVIQKLAGNPGQRSKARLARRDQAALELEKANDKSGTLKALAASADPATAAAAQVPSLITLVVESPKPKAGVAASFPSDKDWPPMPWYLQKITPDAGREPHSLDFEMTGGPADPTTQFSINGVQYCDKCVNVTTELGDTDQWIIQNSTPLGHPFHIHINPFQLTEQGSVINGQYVAYAKYDPPVWQDTIALPVQGATWDIKAGPIFNQQDAEKKCPDVCSKNQAAWNKQWTTIVEGVQSVCGCTVNNNSDGTSPNGYVKFNHRYLEFTGEYVLHCHFLGHEDRGMMWDVQTVCKKDPKNYGLPKPYPQPECTPPVSRPAGPACTTTNQCQK